MNCNLLPALGELVKKAKETPKFIFEFLDVRGRRMVQNDDIS